MPKTKVIFRKFIGGGVIALFPEQMADPFLDHCSSYMHYGQHGAASVNIVLNTRPATKEEYKPLQEELEMLGYDLKIVKRFTYRDRIKREKQLEST